MHTYVMYPLLQLIRISQFPMRSLIALVKFNDTLATGLGSSASQVNMMFGGSRPVYLKIILDSTVGHGSS